MTASGQYEYDRKKLIILRAALIVIGGAVGATAVWQYFAAFPDLMRHEFQIVIIVVTAVVTAAILGLSAKPFYRLGVSIADITVAAATKLSGRGIAAVVLGLIAAGALVFLFDVMISVIGIWAVRLLLDILVYIAFAALGCYGFTKWLSASDGEDAPPPADNGYLLALDCFSDERVYSAAKVLINVKVCESAYKALCLFGGDSDAANRLDTLVKNGSVGLVKCNKDFTDKAEYAEIEKKIARGKRLRLVYAGESESNSDGVSIEAFK